MLFCQSTHISDYVKVMPEEAIAFTPCDPTLFSNEVLTSPDLGGVRFTGSSQVFDNILSKIYTNISNYKSYPRVVGETGGKNWHFLDTSLNFSDLDSVAKKTVQSAFGYGGQKCSACSIAYVPERLYEEFKNSLMRETSKFMLNESFETYTLINEHAYDRVDDLMTTFIEDDKYKIVYGGNTSLNGRFYCEPTIIECSDHEDKVFNQEFFAPILTLYKYSNREKAMDLGANSNNYALTGAVFSNSNQMIKRSREFF